MKVPHRRCLGCGTSSPKGELIRFSQGDEGLKVDWEMRLGGRGAYLHRNLQCFLSGSVSKRWGQALRVTGRDLKVLDIVRSVSGHFGWAI